jgi:predicted dehydrogenase
MAREHIRAFAAIQGVELIGIHSRTRAKAAALAAEFHIPHVCDSVDELARQTRADLVVVAVPELSARSVSQACFEHPWIVFMEKPVGYDLADAMTITRAAENAGRTVYVGLNRRFLSSTEAVLHDLGDDDASRFIHIQDQQSLETARSIGHPGEVVANWMFANSIHVIDYLRVLGRGEIKEVRVIRPWNPQAAVVLGYVEFSSGDIGLYEGIWSGPGPWGVTVTTPRRRWEMRPLEQAQFQNVGERKLQTLEPHEWDRTFKPGFRRQAAEVIAAVQGRCHRAPTLAQANETMKLIASLFGKA